MAASLPEDCIEIVLRCADEDAEEGGDRLALPAARERRRRLRSAALVSRAFRRVAARLLPETLVVTSSAELAALERAVERGHLDRGHVRALFVDDTSVEVDAIESARPEIAETTVRSRGAGVGDADAVALEELLERLVCSRLEDFAARLWALTTAMHGVAGLASTFARTMTDRCLAHGIRSVTIGSTAPGLGDDNWAPAWPPLPSSVAELRIDDFGPRSHTLPPMPNELRGLRRLRLGATDRPVGFKPCLFQQPLYDLERLDLVLQTVVPADPRAIFRVGRTDEVSTPSLRYVRIGIAPDGLGVFNKTRLLAYLPAAVEVLDFVVYEDVSEYVKSLWEAAVFADAVRYTLTDLPAAARLRRIIFNVHDTCVGWTEVLRQSPEVAEAWAELVAACGGRGIEVIVDEEDSGMF